MGDYEIPDESAEDAFEDVIANVGATLPRRDSIDARIAADAKNGTGRIINKVEEVGGLTGIKSETRTFEIPSDWKTEHGMTSSNKETDIVPAGEWAGYTWIEAYVNDWTEQQSAPTNPDITVTSPAIADTSKSTDKTGGEGFWTTTTEDVPVSYTATAVAKSGTTISKIELYDGTTLIDTVTGSEINKSVTLEAGAHYLTSKAYNNKGEITTSPTSIVYVTKNDNSIGNETIAEIGNVAFPEDTNVWVKDSKTYIGGSGLINGTRDSFGYWKHPVTGDFEFSAKIESIPKYENGALCGIMFRESLDADSRMIMLSDGWKKYGENIMVPQRLTKGGSMTLGWMKDSNGSAVENNSKYDTTNESLNLTLPKYMKIARSGDILTLSVSNDGVTWTNNIRQPLEFDISGWSKDAYIGLAVDSINGSANDGNPMLPWYTIGGFSNIKMTGVTPYNVAFETNGGQITDGAFTTYSYGDAKVMPSVEKTDYYFGGWYDNASLEGEALEAMPETAAGDQTYYAKWGTTPTPSPTPIVKIYSWTASEADIGKVAGDELMTGLTLVSNNQSTSADYVKTEENGKITDGEVSGSALIFKPIEDGTISVTFYQLGAGKQGVIYDVESGEYLASYTPTVKETVALSAEVEAGKTYYIAGLGTKTAYCAAQFTPANGSETPVESPRPSTEPTPTVEPVSTASPTASPTAKPTATPTVAPTATPTVTPTTVPTIAPTASPTIASTASPQETVAPSTPAPTKTPSELKVEYDKETNKAIITSSEEKTGTVIFASYEEGRLVSVSLLTDVDINIGTTEIEPTENFAVTDTVRVYLWNSIRGLTPLK
ncbi:MAG: InlB B-repeat-containing protein, partial [Clostridia bacterium]|nr:InlB B-repeat-containing protein [Clostridia bacterium]